MGLDWWFIPGCKSDRPPLRAGITTVIPQISENLHDESKPDSRRVGHGSTELAEVRADFQPAATVGCPTKKLI